MAGFADGNVNSMQRLPRDWAKKKLGFSKVKAVKSNARDRVGSPKASFPLPNRKDQLRHKQTKHKKNLLDLLPTD